MELNFLGECPFPADPKDLQGDLKLRIATIFPGTGTMVTLPPLMHAIQRLSYAKAMDERGQAQGNAPLGEAELRRLRESGVDLIIDRRRILIRPDPDNMALAFAADVLMQQRLPKTRIRFLMAREPKVLQALRERGEYWRISPVPQSSDQITETIRTSRIAIGGRPIYYYNATTGTRYLTLQEFCHLADLPDDELRLHLDEIRMYAPRHNRLAHPELAFFAANQHFGAAAFANHDLAQASPATLRAWHAEIAARFRAAVPSELHLDQIGDLNWGSHMLACVVDGPDDTVADNALPGIPPEFFRQIRWLPGGRIENGELVFDSVFEDRDRNPQDEDLAKLCDERVKGFICNYIREFIGLQYVNVGLISSAMRSRPAAGGHRAYIAEVLDRAASRPVVRIIRLQQWGIRQHLDEGKDLLQSILEAENYTEYTLDRRLGCWELGMPLPGQMTTMRVWDIYNGTSTQFHGVRIWTTCFQRDFIPGLATDKIPPDRLRDSAFALKFAELLGGAAAPNLVVGRTTTDGKVIFDGGDEVLILDAGGFPQRLVIADHAGTFMNYDAPLESFAEAYAQPAVKRMDRVSDPAAFADAYVKALADRLVGMRTEYRARRQAFDHLFKHSPQGEKTFAWRWGKALARLEACDVPALARRVRQAIVMPAERPAGAAVPA